MLGKLRYTDEYQRVEVEGRKCKSWNETGAEARQRSDVLVTRLQCVTECGNFSYVLMLNPQAFVK